jgi:hypothetical protein
VGVAKRGQDSTAAGLNCSLGICAQVPLLEQYSCLRLVQDSEQAMPGARAAAALHDHWHGHMLEAGCKSQLHRVGAGQRAADM